VQSMRVNDTPAHACLYPVIKCARCGERLVAPEWSQYVDERRVRHVWKCEPCGYSFEATICPAGQRT
jgi:transcription elongation factor Elf1